MKCENCGAEIPKGDLYCKVCGWEVRLVPDYITVESMMSEKQLKEKKKLEEQRARRLAAEEEARKKKPKLWVLELKFLLFAGLTAAFSTLIIHQIDASNRSSYVYQRNAAQRALEREDYETAASYAQRAENLKPDAEGIQILKAQILDGEGKSDQAVDLLKGLIEKNAHDYDAYQVLISILERRGQADRISDLVKKSGSERLKKKYAAYFTDQPEFSLISGIYPPDTEIRLTAKNANIYYTTDLTTPTDKSKLYTGSPIPLKNGTKTTVKAVAINKKGVSSEVVTAVYTLKSVNPDPPVIRPDSGSYRAGTEKIEVVIPEGCTVYYVIDGTPTKGTGTVYTQPVKMPEGTHIFSAIVQDIEGHISDVTSRTYKVS